MHQQAATSGARSSTRRKARTSQPAEELIQTSFRLPRSRWKKLHELSLDDRLSVQAIIVSALEAEFERRGLSF
jgi:predicted DNA-binding ribbon-helix-helix protein